MVALGERTTPNGQELLAEFIQYGHQKPFEEIVRRYAGMVYNVCYRITKDKHEAEDATQAVFLTLALQAKRGADIKALGPWLQQVAKRLSLDTRRSKKRRINREERHHAEQTVRRESLLEDAVPSADLDELKTILHEELQKLPAKYRMPLILHYFGGLTREEMAVELNCKPSTLGVRIFRGREMLAGRLSNRGIHISAGMLAAVLGYAVKRAVSDTLIASTSHAATAIMAGYDGAGFASAHVIGLTRRATGALALGKVRVAAITFMLAGTSLGAGAKALGILPQIDVRQMITDQLKRMVRPLMNPFSQPLHVSAQTAPAGTNLAAASPAAVLAPPINVAEVITQVNPPMKQAVKPAAEIADSDETGSNGGIFINTASAPATSAWTTSVTTSSRSSDLTATVPGKTESASPADDSVGGMDPVAASASSATGGSGIGGGLGGAASGAYHFAEPMASIASDSTSRGTDIVLSANDLYVGSPSNSLSTRSSSGSTSIASATGGGTPASLIQISSVGGTVTESSAGIVRGWGIIDRSGTLQMNGKVVADGQGIDRTLNLSSFTDVQTAASNTIVSTSGVSGPVSSSSTATTPATSSGTTSGSGSAAAGAVTLATASVSPQLCGEGWYAINHGRLALPLLNSSSNPSMLTWGDDPDSPSLNLVNSVRLTLQGDNTSTTTSATGETSSPRNVPLELSLLASDRTDVPDSYQFTGAPIGLWQVDSGGSDLTAADITIDYNSVLADLLGAAPSSVKLWTFSDDSDTWQTVAPSTFSLDATDHLVSGYATNIDDIAVTVDPAPGQNVDQVLASHLAQVSSGPEFGATANATPDGTQGVPEPAALSLVLLSGTALLGRRRRGPNRK